MDKYETMIFNCCVCGKLTSVKDMVVVADFTKEVAIKHCPLCHEHYLQNKAHYGGFANG